jgi:hypothetical protein
MSNPAAKTPAEPRSPLTVGELNAFLRSLPSLGDDADGFAQDVRAIRAEFPAEANPSGGSGSFGNVVHGLFDSSGSQTLQEGE